MPALSLSTKTRPWPASPASSPIPNATASLTRPRPTSGADRWRGRAGRSCGRAGYVSNWPLPETRHDPAPCFSTVWLHAICRGQFRHRTLSLHGFQRHTRLERRVVVPAFRHVLFSSSLETSSLQVVACVIVRLSGRSSRTRECACHPERRSVAAGGCRAMCSGLRHLVHRPAPAAGRQGRGGDICGAHHCAPFPDAEVDMSAPARAVLPAISRPNGCPRV